MINLLTIDKLVLQLEFNNPYETFNYEWIQNNYKVNGNCFGINSDVQLRKIPKLEKYYLNAFAVWVGDYYVADLSTDCRQIGQKESIKLAFKNEVFYTKPSWKFYLNKIEMALQLSFKSITILEIANDTQLDNPILPRLCSVHKQSIFLKYNNPAEIKYAPLEGRQSCSVLNNGATYVFGNGLTGKNSTGKQVIVYDKTAEIKESSEKGYILDYYTLNGIDITKSVERIEVKLASKYLKKFLISPSDLVSNSFLEQLFVTAIGSTFKFRDLTKTVYDANRNKKTESFSLIDFDGFNSSPLYLLPIYSNQNERDIPKRQTAKFTLYQYIKFGRKQDLEHLQHLKNLNAPKNCTWHTLFQRYAKDYEGRMTEDIVQRINQFK
jgi:hypothetical protein